LASFLAASPSLAIPGVSGVWLESGEGELYANVLATHLRQRGLTVVATEDIVAVLGLERQKQLTGCATDCSAEIAAALGTDGVLLMRAGMLGRGYSLSVRVVSAKDAALLADASEVAPSADALPFALEHLAWTLARQLETKWPGRGITPGAEPKPVLKTSVRMLAWIPLAVGVVSLGVGVGLRLKANGTLLELQQAPNGTAALTLRDAGKLEQGLGYTLIGVGGAAAVTALLMVVLSPAAEPPVSLGLTPLEGGAFGSLRWSW
jgi:hypothetical protein